MRNFLKGNFVETELKLLDLARDAIIMTDATGKITFWNHGAVELYGWSKEEATGAYINDLLQTNNLPQFNPQPATAQQPCYWEGELIQKTRDAGQITVESRWTLEYDLVGHIVEILQINRDITIAKKRENELAHRAFYDPLTDLPNRALFLDRLAHTITMAKRHHGYKFALFIVDLDHFKSVNDTFGHITGDRLLISIGKRLIGCLRENDTIARLGGDEFAIILDDIKSNDYVTTVVARLQDQFTIPFVLGEYTIHSSVSIGIALGTNEPLLLEKIIQQADTALYQAKKSGKARAELFC